MAWRAGSVARGDEIRGRRQAVAQRKGSGAPNGSDLASRRETFLLSGAVVAAFAVPAFLYLYPLDPQTQFLALWRMGSLVVGLLALVTGALLIRARREAARSLAGLAASLAVMGVLGGSLTLAVTGRLAPPEPPASVAGVVPGKGTGGGGKLPTPAGQQAGKSLAAAAGGVGAAAVLAGGTPGQAGPQPAKSPEEMSAGEKLVRDRCLGCHRLQGYGFGVKDDLDEAGRFHTMSWFVQMLRDPVNVGLKRAKGLHPALADEEIKEVARFLAGRGGSKGEEKPWFGDQKTDMSQVDLIAFGKKAWERLNCQTCHKINGQDHGFMGPDLSHEGSKKDAAAIEDFLVHYVERNPAMPFIPITMDEIRGLAAYLASLK